MKSDLFDLRLFTALAAKLRRITLLLRLTSAARLLLCAFLVVSLRLRTELFRCYAERRAFSLQQLHAWLAVI